MLSVKVLRVLIALFFAGRAQEVEENEVEVGEDAEEEEGEEEEHKITSQDIGVSVMLLGSIIFMMVLYELVHCGKKDGLEDKQNWRYNIRKNTWKVLSSTISIFASVLLFQSINGVIEVYVLEEMPPDQRIVFQFCFALFWFLMLQVVLATLCGVVEVPCFHAHKEEKGLQKMTVRCKTLALLLGHMTGFATISAFASWQERWPHKTWTLVLSPIAAWTYVLVLGRVTDRLRDCAAAELGEQGVVEEHEKLWDEIAEETEDDVAGLAVSFVFVQALRFGISGILPNAEGEESAKTQANHTNKERLALVGMGVVVVVLETIRILLLDPFLKGSSSESKEEGQETLCQTILRRIADQFKNITGMTFSWCIFFFSEWHLSAVFFHEEEGMMYHVVVALGVTTMGVFTSIALARAEDLESTNKDVDKV